MDPDGFGLRKSGESRALRGISNRIADKNAPLMNLELANESFFQRILNNFPPGGSDYPVSWFGCLSRKSGRRKVAALSFCALTAEMERLRANFGAMNYP